jgi:3-hydroxyacyl-[acyl-carrier-protein] dehydratase
LLLNNLYTIDQVSENENTIHASVLLQAEHDIFKGHFPEHPVLPGVCMLEMIEEITGGFLHQHLRIVSAPMIKYLQMIDPNKDPLIQFEIIYEKDPDNLLAQGKIYSGTRVFMKFQLKLSLKTY